MLFLANYRFFASKFPEHHIVSPCSNVICIIAVVYSWFTKLSGPVPGIDEVSLRTEGYSAVVWR